MKRIMRLSLAALLPLLLLMANSVAFGQDLPPGAKTVYRSTLPGVNMQGEFELINLILDFPAGAATPVHTHGGSLLVTVLEGEATFAVEGQAPKVYKAGESWVEIPGEHGVASNPTAANARLGVVAALPKGAAFTTPRGGTPIANPPPGPTTVYRSILPGMTMQGEFEMINLILDFAPGAATPAHNHGGPGIVTVLEGELTFGVEGRPDQMAQPGGVYVDLPGTAHTAANNTSNPARVSYAVVLPKGATLTTLVGGVQAPTPPQGMPRTGQGDPVALLVVIQALAAGLLFIGIGGLVRGRGTRLR